MRPLGLAAIVIALAASTAGTPGAGEPVYRVGAPVEDGASLPVAAGIARLASDRLAALRLVGTPGNGAETNIAALIDGDIDFALVDGLAAFAAFAGSGAYEGGARRELRHVAAVLRHAVQIIVRADQAPGASLSALAGLKGRLSAGPRFGDGRRLVRALLDGLGIEEGRLEVGYRSYPDAVEALAARLVAAVNVDGAVPVVAATQAFATIGADRLRLLRLTEAEAGRLAWRYPGVWFAETIAAGTYPGLDAPVRVPALARAIVTRARLPAAHVYALVAVIFDNLDEVHKIHPAVRRLALDDALQGLSLPLHAGAARYYREKGVPIPERLRP